jgi:hypothetical protein
VGARYNSSSSSIISVHLAATSFSIHLRFGRYAISLKSSSKLWPTSHLRSGAGWLRDLLRCLPKVFVPDNIT